jgi:hypothetical protein
VRNVGDDPQCRFHITVLSVSYQQRLATLGGLPSGYFTGVA